MDNKSEIAYKEACKYIPGGVNSPVRAFKGVGGTPKFIKYANGSKITDIDNNIYIDYVGSWGPMLLGHANEGVLSAIKEVMPNGLSFGAPTKIETELAEKIVNRVSSVDSIRMCNSGTEATMSAIRLARGYTGRDIIIKFEGCYHGHSDSLLVKAGSGMLTLGVPSSLGIPSEFAKYTLTLTYNNIEELKSAFVKYGKDIAAVIVEPIAGNMNLVVPQKDFLFEIRNQCDKYNSVFISDEVMTGFRVARGGAEELFGFKPDLVTFGKVIGGGMPVGGVGGKKKIMELLSPLGGVYQAGTLSGNPISMAAGVATLDATDRKGFYDELYEKTSYLANGIKIAAKKQGHELFINYVCGMFGLFFTDMTSINSFTDVMSCDADKFAKFFNLMLLEGVYLAPSAFETGFVSIAHSKDDLDKTILAAERVFKNL